MSQRRLLDTTVVLEPGFHSDYLWITLHSGQTIVVPFPVPLGTAWTEPDGSVGHVTSSDR